DLRGGQDLEQLQDVLAGSGGWDQRGMSGGGAVLGRAAGDSASAGLAVSGPSFAAVLAQRVLRDGLGVVGAVPAARAPRAVALHRLGLLPRLGRVVLERLLPCTKEGAPGLDRVTSGRRDRGAPCRPARRF